MCGPEASFDSLRAEGAFLVSASYRDGVVEWVHITSEVGRECAVHNPWPQGDAVLRDLCTGAEVLLNGEVLDFCHRGGGTVRVDRNGGRSAAKAGSDLCWSAALGLNGGEHGEFLDGTDY